MIKERKHTDFMVPTELHELDDTGQGTICSVSSTCRSPSVIIGAEVSDADAVKFGLSV